MTAYNITFYDSKGKEVNEGDWIKIISNKNLVFFTKFKFENNLPIINKFCFNTFEVVEKVPGNIKECHGPDMAGIYYLLDADVEIDNERNFVMDCIYFNNMNAFYKLNKIKCSDACIHFGGKHPCVFCIRDPKNNDHFEEGQRLKSRGNT